MLEDDSTYKFTLNRMKREETRLSPHGYSSRKEGKFLLPEVEADFLVGSISPKTDFHSKKTGTGLFVYLVLNFMWMSVLPACL